MRIAILSRNRKLHSVRRLLEEAALLKVDCDVVNPIECQIVIDGANSAITQGGSPLPYYDAILPRIGASVTNYGLAVVRQFQALGTRCVNDSKAIAESRDKMRCLQVLAEAGLHVPPTVLTRSNRGLRAAISAVRGMPVVLKVLKGTQGVGVMLVHTPISLESVLDTLRGLDQDVILQQFIAEGSGRDYRVFIVGGKVVAAMMRTAPAGEFRSNIHRGGTGEFVKLPRAYQQAALRAVRTLGLQVAGVDLIESNQGPMVLEVNSSPGFEGIESVTGLNVAAMIMKHLVAEGRGQKRARKTFQR